MRSSFFVAVPILAIASAQRTTSYGTTLVPEISGSVTVTSTFTYSNPATSLLTQTNSDGVITGLPGIGPTGVVTSQPAVATIPAGLPKGETTLYYSASKTLESFAISVGPKTTVVLGGDNVGPNASVVSGSSAGVAEPTGKNGGNGGGSGGGNGNGNGNGGSGSSSSTSSDNAAPTQMRAAAGLVAFGAVAAVFL